MYTFRWLQLYSINLNKDSSQLFELKNSSILDLDFIKEKKESLRYKGFCCLN